MQVESPWVRLSVEITYLHSSGNCPNKFRIMLTIRTIYCFLVANYEITVQK